MTWEQADRVRWLQQQVIQRSYKDLVLKRLDSIPNEFERIEYGRLSVDPKKYPLFFLRSKMDPNKPTALVTGGVHGYETSGVLGALAFLESEAPHFIKDFNIVCFPCLSPWSFETINRWNNKAIDPNRSFRSNSPAEEAQFFLEALQNYKIDPIFHIDLHETTDTDNTIFRPALAARDGLDLPFDPIPDGFYLVGSTEHPEPSLQKAIIEAVQKVTHIAEADGKNCLIGEPLQQKGVVNYDLKKLNLCAGATSARFVTTTEVYPDSPRSTPQICIDAQIAAICGGLNFVRISLA